MKLLAINTSILGVNSVSRQLMSYFLNCWQKENSTSEILYRDLVAQPITHLSAELLNAKQKTVAKLPLEIKKELELSDLILEEFINAHDVIIGAPMYNFSIASQLKAWIDRILVAGRTFKYTEQGVIGLVPHKKITIISTRGNHYFNNEFTKVMDHQETYLNAVFNFIGIPKVTIIRAEGLHINESIKNSAIAQAEQQIRDIFLNAA